MSSGESIEYRFKGRIFDAAGIAIIEEMQEELVEMVAVRTKTVVGEEQVLNFQNPTGAYEASIEIDGAGVRMDINDGGSVYGPWLEGTGSRNQTTKFKGYHIMRTVTQEMNDGGARDIIEATIPKYIAELNE